MIYPDFTELYRDVVAVWGPILRHAEYWLPIILGAIFWDMWIKYLRLRTILNIDWVMLEISVPKEVLKTPLAMEVVLNAFYQPGEGEWHEKYVTGKVKDWFSLELVSLGGAVKFFIRAPKAYKTIVESQLYSQYPNIEVREVPDYTRAVDYRGKEGEWGMWSADFILAGPDPLPIKTYVDYGLDKPGLEEEYKVDPIVSTLEFLGSIKKDEQVWIQILVTGTGKRYAKPGTWFGKRDWKDEGKELIEEIIKKARKRSGKSENAPVMLTEVEQNTIKAIDRSLSKLGFDCGIRAVYLAKGGAFSGSTIKGLIGAFRHYNSNNLNGFRPARGTKFDHPWQDWKEIRVTKKKKEQFSAYKRRSYFYVPYPRKPFILNLEELATIYHFPGGVAQTPTFGRVSSRKGEPPPNLPM